MLTVILQSSTMNVCYAATQEEMGLSLGRRSRPGINLERVVSILLLASSVVDHCPRIPSETDQHISTKGRWIRSHLDEAGVFKVHVACTTRRKSMTHLYPSLEGSAEHQGLPVRARLLNDGAHLVLEPHVKHPVSLVQDLMRKTNP